MMQQYQEAKKACPDALLLFRMGDFYELFFDDARQAASMLGLALTSRDKGDNPVPMAGFPHHQLESYLRKLIGMGKRVAVCEQVEDPRLAKGLVKREVTRVVTPGTITDDALLDPRQCNFLAAVWPPARRGADKSAEGSGQCVGLAWVELSTGKFLAAVVPLRRLADELARIQPAECLLPEGLFEPTAALSSPPGPSIASAVPKGTTITRRPDWVFGQTTALETLTNQFGTLHLEGFGFAPYESAALAAAGAALHYLQETQKSRLDHIDRLLPCRPGQSLDIDESTRRSLEITQTLRDGRREGSLLAVIDRTVTPMGSRLLFDWIANPLADIPAIEARYDAIQELLDDAPLCEHVREKLGDVYDVQRLLARVTTGRATPRDLSHVGRTLRILPALKARLTARKSALLNSVESQLDLCPELRSRLDAALVDAPPLSAHEGSLIRAGYDEKLDALRELASGGKQWIASYQSRESERTGIPSLKVGYNKVFGYYIEVTNVHREKVPPEYVRKQTVKNAERYITPELKEYEERVVSADDNSKELEYELFLQLRQATADAALRLQSAASALAQLDVLVALANLARQRNYCRPRLCKESLLDIRDGRHPVLDVLEPDGTFVPNDAAADESSFILLITGPNMAGKSTYIRQVALIVLLAQAGSFVPARSATIGVADRIFARVGASDELARGQSTFMVEMTETARILHLRRHVAGLERHRAPPRAGPLPHPLRHPLPRADRPGADARRRQEPQRRHPRMAGRSRLPPQDRGRPGRQKLRHPRGAPGGRPAGGRRARQGGPGAAGGGAPRRKRPAARRRQAETARPRPAHALRAAAPVTRQNPPGGPGPPVAARGPGAAQGLAGGTGRPEARSAKVDCGRGPHRRASTWPSARVDFAATP
jgi:DNA mismatch repair protein MutS